MAEYVITIKNDVTTNENVGVASASTQTSINATTTAKKEISAIKPMAALGIAKQIVTKNISHQVNTVALRTGQEELQQITQFRWGMAQRGISMLAAVGVGFATGNVPLALVGVGASVMMSAVDISQRAHEINLNSTIENISINMANIRAGAADDRQGRNS